MIPEVAAQIAVGAQIDRPADAFMLPGERDHHAMPCHRVVGIPTDIGRRRSYPVDPPFPLFAKSEQKYRVSHAFSLRFGGGGVLG